MTFAARETSHRDHNDCIVGDFKALTNELPVRALSKPELRHAERNGSYVLSRNGKMFQKQIACKATISDDLGSRSEHARCAHRQAFCGALHFIYFRPVHG